MPRQKLLASTPKDLQKHANPLWTQLLVLFNNTKNITKIFRSSSLFLQPYSKNTVVCYLMLMLSLFEFIFGIVSPPIQNNTIAMATKSVEHHSYYKNKFPRQYWKYEYNDVNNNIDCHNDDNCNNDNNTDNDNTNKF